MASITNWNDEDDLPLAEGREIGPEAGGNGWLNPTRRRVIAVTLTGAALWSIFAWGIAPAILRSGYAGTSIGPINELFDYRHEYPFEHYWAKFANVAALALVSWLALGALTLGFSSRTFAKRFVPPATPGAIGVIRCLVSLLCIYYVTIWDDLPALAHLPAEMRKPMGSLEFFYKVPGFAAMVASEDALRLFRAVLVALFILAAVGWKTKIVLPIASILFLAFGGLVRSYQWYYHNGLIPWYILTVLCFMPAADGWSVDRLIKIWRGTPVPPSDKPAMRYGWARYVIWMCIAIPYVEAGASKLRNTGFDWWHAHNMRQMLSADSLKPNTEKDNLTLMLDEAPDWIFAGLGLAGVGGELLMGLVLFSATARLIMPAMMFSMHIGIKLFQGILFLDLMVLETVFYNWRRVRQWVGRKIARRRGTIEVLFDAHSPRAQRCVAILHGLDLFERLTFTPTTSDDTQGTIALDRGTRLRGFAAVKKLSWSLPALWLIAPLLQLLPARSGEVRRADHVSTTAEYVAPARRWALLRPGGIALLTVTLGAAWYQRLEWFPFTGMQMYSQPRSAHAKQYIDHIKVYATDASGHTWPANLGKMSGVARYWRVVEAGFKTPHQRATAEKFILSAAERFNRSAPADKRVTRMRVEQWRWDYVNSPADENRGAPVAEILVEIPGDHLAAAHPEPPLPSNLPDDPRP
ncbi:MAG TPA: hypothetical protein VGR35_21635 [Tepidisphaeraceae bacterium]|nr:hypothetical protein [Tepidisphaeraceae bacterium]